MDPRGGAVEAATDGDGRFVADAVDAGLHRVRARPDNETNRLGAYWGDSWGFCSGRTVELEVDDDLDGVIIELPVGGSLTGVVQDHDGAPLALAEVSAVGLDFYNATVTRHGVADSDGRFEIAGLDSLVVDGEPVPGHYRIEARSVGSAPWYAPGAPWSRRRPSPRTPARRLDRVAEATARL